MEMPKNISELNPTEVLELIQFVKNTKEKAIKLCDYHTMQIFVVEGTGFEVFYAVNFAGVVAYAAKVKKVEQHPSLIPQGFAGRQVLIKKFTSSPSFRISQFIFWLILEKYGTIVSDIHQTPDGRSFWGYRMLEALEKGHKVQMLDTNSREITTITSPEQLDMMCYNGEIWGDANWFTRILLCISKKD